MSERKTGMTPAALDAFLRGDLQNYLAATRPGGIEAQEAAGQRTMNAMEVLPRECNWNCTRAQFEALGIVYGEDVDELFVQVTLPKGWRTQATDHNMWSELLDDKGRKRAGIFYKAAFYDRRAFLSIERRYSFGVQPEGGYMVHPRSRRWRGVVTDQDKVIWQTEAYVDEPDYEDKEAYHVFLVTKNDGLEPEAKAWLTAHYPDFENPLSYWD